MSAIGNAGAEALARALWFGSLRRLGLGFNGLGPAGVTAVAGSRRLTELKYLDLKHNAIGVRGLQTIAGNPALRGLTTLLLKCDSEREHHRGLTEAHFHKFLTKLDMPELRHLSLSGRPLGGKTVRLLASDKFRSLTRLDLSNCKLTDAAVAALATAPALKNLIELNLSDNKLSDGLKPLASPRNLPQLSSCPLRGNRFGAALAKTLRRRPVLGQV